MDPLSIIGSVLTIVGAVATSYNTIEKITDLPKAFGEVRRNLPLVGSILEDVRRNLERSTPTKDQQQSILEVIKPCEDRAKELKRIFTDLEAKCKEDQDAKTWARVREWYYDVLRGMKGHRVESLMKIILEGVKKLALNQIFQLATQEDVEKLKKALEELSKVEPSLDDSEFESKGSIHAEQHVAADADAQQNNVTGDYNTFNQGIIITGGSNTNNFGITGNEDDKLLKNLLTSDPKVDKKRIEQQNGGLLVDSYRWILDNNDFQHWRDNKEGCLLWIKGEPGKGKTMLLCGIIDELKNANATNVDTFNLTYFFCQSTDARLNSGTAVLRGLIFLLVRQQKSLLKHLRSTFEYAGTKQFEDANAWTALSTVLLDILQDEEVRDTILVVDAIDECNENRNELLSLICEISSLSGTKILVTSRHNSDIERKLQSTESRVTLSLEREQNARQVSCAVYAYIDWFISKLYTLQADQSLQDQVKHKMENKASGTFLWVALVAQELQDIDSCEIEAVLDEMPSGLKELYTHKMEQIRNSVQNSRQCEQILRTVVIAYRPLQLDELKILSGLAREDFKRESALLKIVDMCSPFLTIRDRTVYIVHQSAKDFLVEHSHIFTSPSSTKLEHVKMVARSLDIMSDMLVRNVYHLPTPSFSIYEVVTPDPDPLVLARYSCVYWIRHQADSDPESKETHEPLQDDGKVHTFLNHYFLNWVEALSLLGSIPEAIHSMSELVSIVYKLVGTSNLTSLAQDAVRFLRFHKWCISMHPLQVYISALLFSPLLTVRQRFVLEEPKSLVTKPSMGNEWGSLLRSIYSSKHLQCLATFSPNSVLLAVHSMEKTVAIWNLASMRKLYRIKHLSRILSLVFSPDSNFLAYYASTVSDNESRYTIQVVYAATGKNLQTIQAHSLQPSSLIFLQKSHLAAVSEDGNLQVWDTNSGKTIRETLVSKFTFSSDLAACAYASKNGIQSFKVAQGEDLKMHKAQEGRIESLALSSKAKRLASVSSNGAINIWDTESKTCLHSVRHQAKQIQSLIFSADSELLMLVSPGCVDVWDVAKGKFLHTIYAKNRTRLSHYEGLFEVSLHCTLVASVLKGEICQPDIIAIYDTAKGNCLQKLECHNVKSLQFSADLKSLALTTSDATSNGIQIWSIVECSCIRKLELKFGSPLSICFSPNSQLLASILEASGTSTVNIWDAFPTLINSPPQASGFLESCLLQPAVKEPKTMDQGGNITWMEFSNDSAFLLTLSRKRVLKVWDTDTSQCWREFKPSANSGYYRRDCAAFAPNSTRFTWLPNPNTISIWDLRSGQSGEAAREVHKSRSKPTSPLHTSAITFAPDSVRIAFGSRQGKVSIWHTTEDKYLWTFNKHEDNVDCLAFSLDGLQLASASRSSIVISNITTRIHRALQVNNEKTVCSLAFSPNLAHLAYGLFDGTITICSSALGSSVHIIEGYSGPKMPMSYQCRISFDTKGQFIRSTSARGECQLHRVLPVATDPAQSGLEQPELGYDIHKKWVRRNGEKWIWLPWDYCDSRSAVSECAVAVSCNRSNGSIRLFKFSNDKSQTLVGQQL